MDATIAAMSGSGGTKAADSAQAAAMQKEEVQQVRTSNA